MAVSKRLRYEVLRRDGHTCRYCGGTAPDVKLTVDHVTPVALGGTDTADNLVTACGPCNSGKTSSAPDASLVDDVADDALRWANAMKQAAENLREQEKPKLEYREAFLREWSRWGLGKGDNRKSIELPGDWKPSIENFRLAGLPAWVWADIVDAAMGRDKVLPENKFKYCCGIAWNKVTELQADARRIVAPATAAPDLSPLGQVAFDVWSHTWREDHEEEPPADVQAGFAQSVQAYLVEEEWLPADRFIAAASAGGSERCPTIQASLDTLTSTERAEVVIEWGDAWCVTGDSAPDGFFYSVVAGQVDAIAEHYHGDLSRIRLAAILAGYHQTTELHFGLRPADTAATGVSPHRRRAVDLWSRSFRGAAARWPTDEERAAFFGHMQRVFEDGRYRTGDLFTAAVAAGTYQDPDMTTCLTRHSSVFEAAESPLPAA
jgi:hypothetical protein